MAGRGAGVLDEAALPRWLRDALAAERALFTGSDLPQVLGSPGYRVHDLGDGWWVWDNGTGGCLVSDGRTADGGLRWINWDDIDAEHPWFSRDDRARIAGMAHRYWG